MKRKNREINIFSISALDLFASAMGAFLLIAVAALPYYLKTNPKLLQELQQTQQQLQQAQQENQQTQQQLNQCQTRNQQVEEQITACREQLSKTFLTIMILWGQEDVDIDLHVIDPDGNHFYFSKNNRTRGDFSGTAAQLTWDVTDGPGVELWESFEPKPGLYKVSYNYYAGNASTDVLGKVYFKDGAIIPKTVRLRAANKKQVKHIYSLRLTEDGVVQLIE